MNTIDDVRYIEFQQRGDDRGHLVVVEGADDVPFEIKRIFYIYGTSKGVVRGQHANRKTEFALINVAGNSKVRVKDGNGREAVYCLEKPHTGIYLPAMIWKDMYDFSQDSVLLVLASEHYNAGEYIRVYSQYLSEFSGGGYPLLSINYSLFFLYLSILTEVRRGK